ncbi:MAG: hypothetical protein KFB93_03095 [Simkaniaceae bacterium]|nr:MAG: hypothetical protein KFB93_03095 [Simkaniaceae bacterium]
MENLNQALAFVRKIPEQVQTSVLAYHQEILQKPEQSQQRALILTVALTVIAAIGTGFAIRKNSLTSAAFTPLVVLYSQASVLIYSLKLKPESEIDETIALDQKKIIRYALIALTVFGGLGTAALLQKLSGFAALFALLTAGSGAALWHDQGVVITPFNE